MRASDVDRLLERHESELARLTASHKDELDRLVQVWDGERATLMEQLKMLQAFLNPQIEPGPPAFEATEEQEHLAFLQQTGQIDPALQGALAELGLDPDMQIDSATD